MSFNGVNVNKLNGGLGGTNPTLDRVMLLAYAVALADLPAGVTHYETTQLLQVSDAEAIGFTPAWDANEKYLLHSEVSELFRLSPEASVYLMPVPTGLDVKEVMQTTAYKTALRAAKDVKILGFGNFAETIVDLIDLVEDIQTEIGLYVADHRLIDAVIIGAKGTVTATSIAGHPDFRAKNAPNVSIVIAQDPAVAALDAAYAKYASVGAALGMLSIRKVNENLGSVNILEKPAAKKADPNYPLSSGSKWATASLSDGTPVSALSSADMSALSNKGYIFAGGYQGYAGIFFNDSPTCVEEASDYNRIENNCVWNKAARLIRTTLLPEVKGVVKKDPATGKIRSTTIARWENLLHKALETQMMANDEISGKSFYIDPNQTPGPSNPIVVKASVVKDGIVHEFSVDLGLTNNI